MMFQPVKTEDGIKVTTDHDEELTTDVVFCATGNFLCLLCLNLFVSYPEDNHID